MIKKILLSIVALIFIVLIYASTRPDTFQVEVSQSIKAAPEKIFPHINNLHAWNEWSPFEKGIEMKKTYSGPEEGAGSSIQFEGGKSGSGTSSIIASSFPTKIYMKLIMTKPLHYENDIMFTLVPMAGVTTITWNMKGPVNFLGKVMGLFFSDEMVREQFNTGLSNLKTLVETESTK